MIRYCTPITCSISQYCTYNVLLQKPVTWHISVPCTLQCMICSTVHTPYFILYPLYCRLHTIHYKIHVVHLKKSCYTRYSTPRESNNLLASLSCTLCLA